MLLTRFFVLLAVILLAPTAVHAQSVDLPEWMQKDMQREKKSLKFREVIAGENAYMFELPGKAEAPAAFDGGWYVSTDIKSGSPVECYIFDEEEDLASLVLRVNDIIISNMATTYEKPEQVRSLYGIDAGGIRDTPYLSLEMLYMLGDENTQGVAGLSKTLVATKGETSVACSHNEIGYRDTFMQIFERFIASLSATQQELEPYYTELTIQSLNDLNVGFFKMTIARDDEGDSLTIVDSAAVIPISTSDLASSDSTLYSWTRPDGTLISATSADAENGEITTNVRIQRNEDGDWLIYGLFQGEEIEYVIDGEETLIGEHGSMLKTRDLLASDDDQTTFKTWVPAADPGKLLAMTIQRVPDIADDAATVSIGPITLTGRFDDNGSAARANMQIGPVNMLLERVWADGSL